MKLSSSLIALIALPIAASAQSVFSDTSWSSPVSNSFVGGDSGLSYYGSSGSGGQLSLTGDSSNLLTLTTATSGRGLLVNFTPQTLASIGDSLIASVTFTIAGPLYTSTSNNFKMTLANSAGGSGLVAVNGFGNTNAGFVGYTGYLGAVSLDTADTAPVDIMDKISTSNAIIGTTGGNLTSLGGGGTDFSPNDTPLLAESIEYTVQMAITAIASGVNIAYSLTGGTLDDAFVFDIDDTTDGVSTFDVLALHVNSNTWNTIELHELSVSYVSAIPEPSSVAFLFGLTAIGFVGMRRRHA